MADTPAAEVAVTERLIEELVAAQHPDLLGPVRIVAHGWDNVVARLGDHLAVRLPRRALAAPLIETEARWLPRLADVIPVPVPSAIRVGSPMDEYPWSWLIVPWLEGVPVTDVPVDRRRALAADLGRAHGALHRPAPSNAPRNPLRGVALAERAEVAEQRLASGVLPRSAELRAIWEQGLAAPPWSGEPLWLHGDAHPGNMLATSAGAAPSGGPARLAALIDFGDLTAGDPASDLAVAWLAFDPPGRAAYRAAHRAALDGPAGSDDSTWMRARAWAVLLCGAFAQASDDNPRMAAIGTHAAAQVLLD